jgi:hypothetical protein
MLGDGEEARKAVQEAEPRMMVFWLRMNHLTLLRELKRIELRFLR